LNISRQTLYRELKKQNTDFKSLFESIRKEQALLLLSSGKETIDSISLKLGYKDNSSFHKAFKRWYGQSPAMYSRLNF
jgi:AraC-like DNA-binding protein